MYTHVHQAKTPPIRNTHQPIKPRQTLPNQPRVRAKERASLKRTKNSGSVWNKCQAREERLVLSMRMGNRRL